MKSELQRLSHIKQKELRRLQLLEYLELHDPDLKFELACLGLREVLRKYTVDDINARYNALLIAQGHGVTGPTGATGATGPIFSSSMISSMHVIGAGGAGGNGSSGHVMVSHVSQSFPPIHVPKVAAAPKHWWSKLLP